MEYQLASKTIKQQVIRDLGGWTIPNTGVAKVNWDAAINKNNQKMDINIIAQDNYGEVLAYLVAS